MVVVVIVVALMAVSFFAGTILGVHWDQAMMEREGKAAQAYGTNGQKGVGRDG